MSEKVLLIIDSNPENNWYKVFAPFRSFIKVEQTAWNLIEVFTDADSVSVQIKPSPDPIFGTSQKFERTVSPDFMLVRNFVLGIHGENYVNQLLALMVGNVESVNSLHSIFQSTERATFIAELKRIQQKLGKDKFPLIPMKFYPNVTGNISPKPSDYPLVAKVGTNHAGYGKMKFANSDFVDFSTVMAMYKDYVTTEPFVSGSIADIRIQQIGSHIRAYKRTLVGEGWKGNVGVSELEDIAVSDEYKEWMKECSSMFGGLDILSLDAVIDKEGRHTILEVNDTATGFSPIHKDEDTIILRDLVVDKIKKKYNL